MRTIGSPSLSGKILPCALRRPEPLPCPTSGMMALQARLGDGPLPLTAVDDEALAIATARGAARLVLDSAGTAWVVRGDAR